MLSMVFAAALVLTVEGGALRRVGDVPGGASGTFVPVGVQWESQLQHGEKWAFANALEEMGATETTLTVFGGLARDSAVNILTATEETRAEWRAYVARLNQGGIVPIVYLAEQEHNGRIDDATREAVARAAAETFAGLEVIWCLGEELDAGPQTALKLGRLLREVSSCLIAMHNPVDALGYARWSEAVALMIADGCLDVVLVQATLEELPARVAAWRRDQVAVIAHEQNPYEYGTRPTVEAVTAWALEARGAGAAGFSIYPGYLNAGCGDLWCPDPRGYAEGLARARTALTAVDPDGPRWPRDRNADGVMDAADAVE